MKKYLVLAVFALIAFMACSKDNKDGDITNTLVYDGQTYKVDFEGGFDENGMYNCDIHFVGESSLAQAWGMMWAVGKVGTFTLPAKEEDFQLTKNTYPDYDIKFKSGTAKSWVDDKYLCLVVDGKTEDGKSLKLSVKSQNPV